MSCVICGENVPALPSADDPDAVSCPRCRGLYTNAPGRNTEHRFEAAHVALDDTFSSVHDSVSGDASADSWSSMVVPLDAKQLRVDNIPARGGEV